MTSRPLADYDEHGRLHGGSYEEMTEAAARAYVADLLEGKDSILMANSNDEVRDLGRRVQSYLREWGKLGDRSFGLREGCSSLRR